MRIGHGFDVHRLGSGDHLMIGGVRIEYHQGFIAHSDGDVLLHAICDALLGAASLGDIGVHFPDTDPQYKGIDSRELLKITQQKIEALGFSIQHIDSIIVAQAPKMQPHIPNMRHCISQDLMLPESAINIKATTTEQLGFTGRKEGIAAYAVCLLLSA